MFQLFPWVQSSANDLSVDDNISGVVTSLQNLKQELLSYFTKIKTEDSDKQRWILNPFLETSVQFAELDIKMKEELIEISSDSMLKM